MKDKNHYSAPNLEEICEVPASILCESGNTYTSPIYGGQEDDLIF